MSLPLPRLLQLAGEAGDFGVVQIGPDVLDAERARRLVLGLGRPGVERPDVFLAPEPPFRAVRPRLQIDALRVALGRLVYHVSPPSRGRIRRSHPASSASPSHLSIAVLPPRSADAGRLERPRVMVRRESV